MSDFVTSGIRANKFGHEFAFYLLHFYYFRFFGFFFLIICKSPAAYHFFWPVHGVTCTH